MHPINAAEVVAEGVQFIVVGCGPKDLAAICKSLEKGGMKRRYARVDAKKPLAEREFVVWEM